MPLLTLPSAALLLTAAAQGTPNHRTLILRQRLTETVPLPVIMVMIGGLFLGTLVISHFSLKVGSGLLMGIVLGYVAHFTLDRLVREHEQLLVMGISIGLLAYGLSDLLGGSGYISCYITGLFLSNYCYRNRRITTESLRNTLLPFNTMTEIVVFLIFGLVMSPARLIPSLPEGIVTALALMLVARPLSVFAFQWLSPFRRREALLISWCGLRGASTRTRSAI